VIKGIQKILLGGIENYNLSYLPPDENELIVLNIIRLFIQRKK